MSNAPIVGQRSTTSAAAQVSGSISANPVLGRLHQSTLCRICVFGRDKDAEADLLRGDRISQSRPPTPLMLRTVLPRPPPDGLSQHRAPLSPNQSVPARIPFDALHGCLLRTRAIGQTLRIDDFGLPVGYAPRAFDEIRGAASTPAAAAVPKRDELHGTILARKRVGVRCIWHRPRQIAVGRDYTLRPTGFRSRFFETVRASFRLRRLQPRS